MRKICQMGLPIFLVSLLAVAANAQLFMVQCPTSSLTHPVAANNNSEPAYSSATAVNGAIKCQQVSGGDGYATMGDGTQIYMFSFGPLSGLADIAAGLPGTEFPRVFNTPFTGTLVPGDPATTGPSFTFNGAVGQVPDVDNGGAIDGHVDPRQIMDIGVMNGNIP